MVIRRPSRCTKSDDWKLTHRSVYRFTDWLTLSFIVINLHTDWQSYTSIFFSRSVTLIHHDWARSWLAYWSSFQKSNNLCNLSNYWSSLQKSNDLCNNQDQFINQSTSQSVNQSMPLLPHVVLKAARPIMLPLFMLTELRRFYCCSFLSCVN